jgi:cellulose synthase operon protein C
MKQIPPALAVLSREIEHNPDDPGLYERLAVFLDQNRLGSQQEEVYRRALARFSDKSWYDKLARFYVRYKRTAEFEQLTRDAVSTFKGSELEHYFSTVVGGSPGLYLRLNLYANKRFPHNPVFVRNLLGAYQTAATRDPVAWEALLRQHWFEDASLRNRFFEFLSAAASWNPNSTRSARARPMLRVGKRIPLPRIFWLTPTSGAHTSRRALRS